MALMETVSGLRVLAFEGRLAPHEDNPQTRIHEVPEGRAREFYTKGREYTELAQAPMRLRFTRMSKLEEACNTVNKLHADLTQ